MDPITLYGLLIAGGTVITGATFYKVRNLLKMPAYDVWLADYEKRIDKICLEIELLIAKEDERRYGKQITYLQASPSYQKEIEAKKQRGTITVSTPFTITLSQLLAPKTEQKDQIIDFGNLLVGQKFKFKDKRRKGIFVKSNKTRYYVRDGETAETYISDLSTKVIPVFNQGTNSLVYLKSPADCAFSELEIGNHFEFYDLKPRLVKVSEEEYSYIYDIKKKYPISSGSKRVKKIAYLN